MGHTPKLRISSARDSETCGHLNVGAVVNVVKLGSSVAVVSVPLPSAVVSSKFCDGGSRAIARTIFFWTVA